jgi:hypothetical protein
MRLVGIGELPERRAGAVQDRFPAVRLAPAFKQGSIDAR